MIDAYLQNSTLNTFVQAKGAITDEMAYIAYYKANAVNSVRRQTKPYTHIFSSVIKGNCMSISSFR